MSNEKIIKLHFEYLIQEFKYQENKVEEKKYEFKEGFNVFYGDNQQGKSTIPQSIIMSLGGDNVFLKSKSPNKSSLLIKYYNNNLKEYQHFTLENESKSNKLKYSYFLDSKIGVTLSARIKNKYGLKKVTLLDIFYFFYFSQQNKDIDNIYQYKMSEYAICDINHYLISFLENNEYMQLITKKAQLKQNISDSDFAKKLNQIIDKQNDSFKIKENLDIEGIIDNLEEKLNKNASQIQEFLSKKRELQKSYSEYQRHTKYYDEFKKMSSSILKEINGFKVSAWDLFKDHEILGPKFSVNDINLINSRITQCDEELQRLKLIQKNIIESMDKLPKITIWQFRKKQIMELLINLDESDDKLSNLNDELKKIDDEIKKIEQSLEILQKNFNKEIIKEMDELNFNLSDSGVGQQIERIIKMLHFQKNCNFPIVIDGFMDGATLENKKRIVQYIIKNSKHQVIVFCTIKDDDEFLDFLKKEDNINLHKIVR